MRKVVDATGPKVVHDDEFRDVTALQEPIDEVRPNESSPSRDHDTSGHSDSPLPFEHVIRSAVSLD